MIVLLSNDKVSEGQKFVVVNVAHMTGDKICIFSKYVRMVYATVAKIS